MDHRVPPSCDSLEEVRRPTSHSCPRGSAIHVAKKPSALRIVVPPTEYCPFSTDLTLPIIPHALPTPVSPLCFTFSDTQELVSQSTPPTPAAVPSLYSRYTTVPGFASPTSSQFLLMPSNSHMEDVDGETVFCDPTLSMPAVTDESNGVTFGNLRPWEVSSSSTWLNDLGGHAETDRIFRQSLLEVTSIDTDSSTTSTPALSQSAMSPFSQVPSVLAYDSPTSPARSPASLPPTLSPDPPTMSLHSSSPARLALKPTGTDAFPSTLEGLEAWRESVAAGTPQSKEPHSPLTEEVDNYRLPAPAAEGAVLSPMASPSHHSQSRQLFPQVSYIPKPHALIKHAKILGGRVKQLITRRTARRHRNSMDRGVNFRVITNQDSENGSVILITAPPPPYDNCSLSPDLARSLTTPVHSSPAQESTAELSTDGMDESSSRQGGSRNTLRRFSTAALSTVKRL